MSDSKLLKILYGIICLMLVTFFGFGIYFMTHQNSGAGLLAIGIGLIGLGFTLFLGSGFLFAKDVVSETTVYAAKPSGKAVLAASARLKDVLFSLEGTVDGKNADVSVYEKGLSVKSGNSVSYLMLEDIKGVMSLPTGDGFVIGGHVQQDGLFKNMTLDMTFTNKMRVKALEKMLVNANVLFVMDRGSLSKLMETPAKAVTATQEQQHTVPSGGRRKLSDVVHNS